MTSIFMSIIRCLAGLLASIMLSLLRVNCYAPPGGHQRAMIERAGSPLNRMPGPNWTSIRAMIARRATITSSLRIFLILMFCSHPVSDHGFSAQNVTEAASDGSVQSRRFLGADPGKSQLWAVLCRIDAQGGSLPKL
jgi:hypothetical protein